MLPPAWLGLEGCGRTAPMGKLLEKFIGAFALSTKGVDSVGDSSARVELDDVVIARERGCG